MGSGINYPPTRRIIGHTCNNDGHGVNFGIEDF